MTDPLAYFLTWHTYGTWLQGDKRGSVDQSHREYGREFARVNTIRSMTHQGAMTADALVFTEPMRIAVQKAIIEVCEYRHWFLAALHVRTNHVHAVISAVTPPERTLNDFKSYATRALRKQCLAEKSDRVWSRHGSTRYLWQDDEAISAVDYVLHHQGRALILRPWRAGLL